MAEAVTDFPIDIFDPEPATPIEPGSGRMYRARREDQIQEIWPTDYTPRRMRTILSAAADGDPAQAHAAIDAMLESDPTLPGIYETRLNAIKNRPWQIVPATEAMPPGTVDEAAAKATADYCRAQLASIPSLDTALAHLADAIGRSTCVAEIVWQPDGKSHRVVSVVPVGHRSLHGDTLKPWELRCDTELAPYPGLKLSDLPNKWIVHTPRDVGNNPWRGGTHRICLILHTIRRYGWQWWVSCLELFGQPYRKAQFPNGASAEVKAQLEAAMKNFGHAGWGIFPAQTEFEMIQSMEGSADWPHEKLCDHIDARYAVLLLGQTLTTDAGDRGTQALGTVHDKVRADVRDADIAAESNTIRRDLLTPMVRLGPFKPDAPVPFFRRVVEKPVDHRGVLEVLDGAVNRLGMAVTNGFAYAKLDIPLPEGVEPDGLLDGAPDPVNPLGGFGGMFDEDGEEADDVPEEENKRAARRRKRLAGVAIPRVPPPHRKASPVDVLDSWVSEAVDHARRQVNVVVAHSSNAVSDASGPAEAVHRLRASISRLPATALTEALAEYMTACAFAGALVAQRRIEQRRTKRTANERMDDRERDEDDDGTADDTDERTNERPSTFRLPFTKAVNALAERVTLSPDEFRRLEVAARSRAAMIAGQFNLRIVQDVYDAIQRTIDSGGGVYAFRTAINEVPKAAGWSGPDPWHANLVFRNNAAMSFGAGHYAAMESSGVQYWRFRTYLKVDDQNPCPICRPMDGKVFSMTDRTLYPPVHHGCKCYADPILPREDPGTITTTAEIVASNEPYQRSQASRNPFGYDPAQFARTEPLDLAPVPADLRGAFADYALQHGWAAR